MHRWERKGQLRIITISCPFFSLLHIDIRPMFRTHGNHLSSPCCARPRIYYLPARPLRLFPMTHEHVPPELLAQLLVVPVPKPPRQLNPRRDRQVRHRVRRVLRPPPVAQGLRKVSAGYKLWRHIRPVLRKRPQPVRHVLELPLGRVQVRRVPKIGQVVLFHPAPPHEEIKPSVSGRNTPGKKGGKGEMEQSIRKCAPSQTPMPGDGGK